VSFYVYILKSESSSRYYIGHTENLAKRIAEHNNGRVRSAKGRGPWLCIYSETLASKPEAANRELQIKRLKSRKSIEALVARASR
jgi:putative endonuclease